MLPGSAPLVFLNPKKFDYAAPGSLKQATQLLHDRDDAKILAGGQSLLALMKLRLASPGLLVDIAGLQKELSYVREETNHVAIGAMTVHDEVEHNAVIRKRFPILVDAASRIGDQQIRNRGTIGGSCCHADPAADMPTALLALNPVFVVRSRSGDKTIQSSEFFVDTFTTSLERDDILREIRLPLLEKNSGSAYIKHSRREGDFAIVGVGAAITVGPKNACKEVKISLGAVAPTPIRAKAAEKFLIGKTLNDDSILQASERANEGADPPSDMHGSRDYRLDMIRVFTKRTLKLALDRLR
jgi:carbon-monoxide dehydrogenase medium subunit